MRVWIEKVENGYILEIGGEYYDEKKFVYTRDYELVKKLQEILEFPTVFVRFEEPELRRALEVQDSED